MKKLTKTHFLTNKEIMVLDYECRSGVSLDKGYSAYLADKDFKSLILTCRHYKEGNKENIVLNKEPLIREFSKSLIKFSEKNYLVAHNAEFDFAVFQHLTGVPDKYFSRWLDTKTLSCYGGGPAGLFPASKFWNVSTKFYGKDLIDTLCVPYNKRKTPRVVRNVETKNFVQDNGFVEHPGLFKFFEEYAIADLKSTCELFELFINEGILREYWVSGQRANAYINYIRNKKGVNFNMPLVKKFLKQKEEIITAFDLAGKRLTEIDDFNLNSWQQFSRYFKDYSMKKTGRQELNTFLENNKELPKKLKYLVNLRIKRPSVALGKLDHIVQDSVNGRITDSISHFSAFTGRYKSFGVNMLSFPRKIDMNLNKAVLDMEDGVFTKKHKIKSSQILSGLLRHCIKPHEGCIFYGGDFSSIDFRLLLGASEEYKSLKKVYEGWDVYKEMAGNIFKKSEKDVTKNERYVAKRVVLARGYGIGLKGTLSTLAKDDIFVEEATAKKLIELYDDLFPKVKTFWYKLYEPFNHIKDADNVKIKIPFVKENIYFKECFYRVDEKTGIGNIFFNKQGKQVKIYPSALCGLVIQALTARLFHYVERELYKHLKITAEIPVHDEFLCSVREDEVDFEDFKRIIQTSPDWLPAKHYPIIQGSAWKGKEW